jgi:A/G-specific adenine glycosylase
LRDNDADLPQRLLKWYDRNARPMPWRVSPDRRRAGVLPDPYHVWLSEIMLQQTTVAAVKGYFEAFVRRWPTVAALAAAPDTQVMAAWAGLGYYARARNLLKCARIVAGDLDGVFPSSEAALQKLPGIGPYTSAAISAIAFDRPATVLDGNVERVMARLHAVEEPLPASKETLRGLAAELTPAARAGDYAQAVMDLGATICTPASPACGICPWSGPCQARARGLAAELPRKLPKPVKPVRVGVAYVARRNDGALLLEQRPDKGLLGGMLGWPGSDWAETLTEHSPPVAGDWRDAGAEVRHTFTHFHLRLKVLQAEVDTEARPLRGGFVAADAFDPGDLPTVMRKVWALARS